MTDANGLMAARVARPDNVPADRVVDWDMYHPPGLEAGLHESWRQLHAPGVADLVWTPRNGGHWIATRGRLIEQMFRDPEHFSSECIWLPKEAGEEYEFIPTSMDPPEQTPFRELINTGIGLRVAKSIEEPIRQRARSLISAVRESGGCNFPSAYAEPLAIGVFLTLVNLPEDDAPRLKRVVDQITRPDGSISMRAASQLLFDYLSPVIDARLRSPGGDVLSVILQGKVNGRPMTKAEAERVCGLLLLAGLDTVVNFLSFVFYYLAEHPQYQRLLGAQRASIPLAVEEFFRRLPLVADGRLVKHDMVVDGVRLKAGDMVLLPTMLHGLDERENPEPMKFDLQRQNARHSFFGNGPHRCAGLHIARAEVRITLEEWLAAIPRFELASGAKPRYHAGVVAMLDCLPLVWAGR